MKISQSENNLSREELIVLLNEERSLNESLQKEEGNYRELFENAIDGIYKSTPEGKFVDVNMALVNMLGYDSKEELFEIDIKKDLYFDIKDREFEKPEESQETNAMFEMRKKDGSSIWVADSGKIITDDNGEILFHEGTLRDVSEVKKVNQIQKMLLKIAQEGYKIYGLNDFVKFVMNELEQLIDTTNFFIAFYNEKKQTINIPFISGEVADREFPIGKSMTGYLIKKNKSLFLKSEDYTKLIESGKAELVGKFPAVWLGVPLRVEEKVIGAIVVQSYDDHNAFIEDDIELLEIVASHISTVVHRKKIEHEIALSKQLLRNVLDNIPIKVYWKNKDSVYLGCNAAFSNTFGFNSESEVIGKTDFDFSERKEAEKSRKSDFEAMRSGKQKIIYQESLILKGEKRWITTTKLPFTDENDEVIGVIGTSEDITESKEYEISLKKATDEAIAANLSKSTFLSNMSHEIRTPMNAILGYSQLLQDNDNLTKTQHENLKTINRSGEHLLELINDILDMSKIEAGRVTLKLVDFDFIELLKEIENLFKLKAKQKELDFTFNLDKNIPKIMYADESKIKQVIINLVGNALKFTSKGFVEVIVEKGTNNMIIVKIKDSGKGILKEEQETVFKPFEQAKMGAAAKGGTGLGLAISKKLSNLMEGDILVDSMYGKGAEFKFTFKYSKGSDITLPKDINRLKVKTLTNEMKGLKVAIVDDRFENRDILHIKLNSLGFDTRMAENGQEAVDLYKEWKPDIILMDVVMPVMDGVEATRQILEIAGSHKVKIFVVSASALESEQKEVMGIGATVFIKKPVIFDKLLAEMHNKAGVKFIYKDNIDEDTMENITANPRDVPNPIKMQLLNAASEGDFMLLQDLVATLEKDTNKSFKIIEDFIDEMEFEAIVNWLKA
ncbi:MAG: hypothetical protein COB01_03825 [Lutibacter sp.]|nr:MAG: hypothetical protein COB01_03825 [Lutibacter sp.]